MSQFSYLLGACMCNFLQSCSSSVKLPFVWIDYHHGGTLAAFWKSLVGKPRGKATDPLIHSKGNVTLLLLLGRKEYVHAPTRYED